MLNRCGQIDALLDLLGINNSASNYNKTIRKGKILVLGQLDTSVESICKIGENFDLEIKSFLKTPLKDLKQRFTTFCLIFLKYIFIDN